MIQVILKMNDILKIENVSKKFYTKQKKLFAPKKEFTALDNVSFSVKQGEIFGLVGESGSGKSTLGKIILKLLKPTEGKVFYKDMDISKFTKDQLNDYRKQVQMVFQDPYSSLNPHKKIGWSLMEIMTIQKVGTKEERLKRAKDILNDVEMTEDVLEQFPSELSGGQRQRISIASSLIINPQLVIIDEGVSALDVSIQAQILNLLNELQEKYNFTSIFISHDLNVIEYLCDRIAVLHNGVLQEVFKAEDLYQEGRKEYTKKLFKSVKEKLR